MPVVSPLPELLENRQPVIVTAHSLAIDQAGPQSERVDGLDDQREAARPVVAVAGEQADCPSRKSYPRILMMQFGQNGRGDNGSASLDRPPQRRILVQ